MKTVAIIQARLSSTRLPAKVMSDVCGIPMIGRVVQRVAQSNRVDQIVVATTRLADDDELCDYCLSRNWAVYRGDSEDVLSRYLCAARMSGSASIVRITSDCPLIDPNVIDETVELLLSDDKFDYVSNIWPRRTFPRGLDVEAFRLRALVTAGEIARTPEREHVTQAIHRNAGRFKIGSIEHLPDNSEHRWTVDTIEDLQLIREIYRHFESRRFEIDGDHQPFSTPDVLEAFQTHPHWPLINKHIQQKAA